MDLVPIIVDITYFPEPIQQILSNARLYDSSCSPHAKVIFVDKDGGLFVKCAPKGTLEREAALTAYFHSKGLAPAVVSYLSEDRDYLVTTRLVGEDCIAPRYLSNPEKLCDTISEQLAVLHSIDCSDCPIEHTNFYLDKARHCYENRIFDTKHFPDNWGYSTPEQAFGVIKAHKHILQSDCLLHGDYCLPNIILNKWKPVGFVDLDNGGVGDRHVDIFWGIWTLQFNLDTDEYRQRFIDGYGRDRVDEAKLRLIAAIEVFG